MGNVVVLTVSRKRGVTTDKQERHVRFAERIRAGVVQEGQAQPVVEAQPAVGVQPEEVLPFEEEIIRARPKRPYRVWRPLSRPLKMQWQK